MCKAAGVAVSPAMAFGVTYSALLVNAVLTVELKDGKLWIQHDGTEEGIANRLVENGVPKEHIVLAFHAPYKRPYTGYAAA